MPVGAGGLGGLGGVGLGGVGFGGVGGVGFVGDGGVGFVGGVVGVEVPGHATSVTAKRISTNDHCIYVFISSPLKIHVKFRGSPVARREISQAVAVLTVNRGCAIRCGR